MSQATLFPRLDGLMDLAKREGVDVRPTLLRVLTDLYVQTPRHTDSEDRQFIELFSRLIGSVDDATVAAVRARLSVYPGTPQAVMQQFAALPSHATATPRPYAPPQEVPAADAPALAPEATEQTPPEAEAAPPLAPEAEPETVAEVEAPRTPQQQRSLDARTVVEHFFNADAAGRDAILSNLEYSSFPPAAPPEARRSARAIDALERAALARNASAFTMELASALTLPVATAQRIVQDDGGDALAAATKALGMPLEVFQRVLLFLDPAVGTSVHEVYRRSHLYVAVSLRSALTLIALWRLAAAPTAQKYRPALYDDERRRARMPAASGTVREGADPAAQPIKVNR